MANTRTPNELLLNAVIAGDAPKVAEAIDLNADPNLLIVRENTEYSMLRMAVELGFFEVAKVLLEKGANVNFADSQLRATALHKAVILGQNNMIALLMQHGASASQPCIAGSALYSAMTFRRENFSIALTILANMNDLSPVVDGGGEWNEVKYTIGEMLLCFCNMDQLLLAVNALQQNHSNAAIIATIPNNWNQVKAKQDIYELELCSKSFLEKAKTIENPTERLQFCSSLLDSTHPLGCIFLLTCQNSQHNKYFGNVLRAMQNLQANTRNLIGVVIEADQEGAFEARIPLLNKGK